MISSEIKLGYHCFVKNDIIIFGENDIVKVEELDINNSSCIDIIFILDFGIIHMSKRDVT